jgi:raffinose/stachyose/melibiose transport system permease protein
MKKRDFLVSNIFLTPAFVFYTLFVIVPVFLTAYYTLTRWDGVSPKVFIWFQNYRYLFTDRKFVTSAKNTLILVLLCLIIQIPVSLLMAHLVNNIRRGYRFFRTIFFGPVVISSAIIAVMFDLILNADVGVVNYVFKRIGFDFLVLRWLTDPKVVLYSVSLPMVWHYLGIYFIVFLAGLQTIPDEIVESATIDGASGSIIFFRIIIPMIWEIIQIVIILALTNALKAFEYSWIMTWGGPDVASSYLSVYMYRLAFREYSFGYGSTVAFTILIFALAFTVAFKRMAAKFDTG